jgi:hypothetical protein
LGRLWSGTSDDKTASLVAEREVRLQSSHSHGFGAPLGKLCRISNGSFSGIVVPELIDSYQSTADSKHCWQTFDYLPERLRLSFTGWWWLEEIDVILRGPTIEQFFFVALD